MKSWESPSPVPVWLLFAFSKVVATKFLVQKIPDFLGGVRGSPVLLENPALERARIDRIDPVQGEDENKQ